LGIGMGADLARLSTNEFEGLIAELVAHEGLARLQQNLVRSQALVSRRRLGEVSALARHLHQLTLGLERDGVPTRVLIALWDQMLAAKLEEDAGAELEKLAAEINACLDVDHRPLPGNEEKLLPALHAYRSALAGRVGNRAAHLTMLTRAYPAVARILREHFGEASQNPVDQKEAGPS
jgi:hypothetical protein